MTAAEKLRERAQQATNDLLVAIARAQHNEDSSAIVDVLSHARQLSGALRALEPFLSENKHTLIARAMAYYADVTPAHEHLDAFGELAAEIRQALD